jgi:uncharacterized cysteine cluster protein YcgN (CxxCxxCC family)
VNKDPAFWRTKTLAQMTPEEWESLCDGCGQCCLHKIAQPQAPALKTNVACRLLDSETCRCKNYARRKKIVRDCVVLTPENVASLTWLPSTCAYRLVEAGDDLPAWHPLISGDSESVHRAGISVRGRSISERDAGPLEDHVIP